MEGSTVSRWDPHRVSKWQIVWMWFGEKKKEEGGWISEAKEGRKSVKTGRGAPLIASQDVVCKRAVLRWWMVHTGDHLQRSCGCAVLIWEAGAKVSLPGHLCFPDLNTEQAPKAEQSFRSGVDVALDHGAVQVLKLRRTNTWTTTLKLHSLNETIGLFFIKDVF